MAYDHIGMAASVGAQAFFDACAGVLSANGVMSINLWGSDKPLFNQTMTRINQSFDGNSLILPVKDKGNVISMATKWHVTNSDMKAMKRNVEQQEIQFDINLPSSLKNIARQNRSLITRLFA